MLKKLPTHFKAKREKRCGNAITTRSRPNTPLLVSS